MDLLAQLQQKGIQILDGHHRLCAALAAGVTIKACSHDGQAYNLSVVNNELVVEELNGEMPENGAVVIQRQAPANPAGDEHSDLNGARWIKVADYEAAMRLPDSGAEYSNPMLGRKADGEEVPFVTATASKTGVTWSQPVDEVLVEACNRARGWLAKPLW
ncbi:TPA: hypothetical protein ACNVX4_005979 [Pseudomonas aeruginosa]|uniref:hypothetical protein n=1 Tax=Pseudomonas aeruginosa TaxID=287 RepID=UPI00287C4B6F|nr:hypothetical protein [Pseudomonas aeruginosa]EKF7416870.1 hypothetical protein [Pseudomonas aeruginosa]MDS9918426.1 hypothetical protein [Pseudomonas aeruginosa]HCA5866501.1 hypothetical protein [Pseudomonas aeruginosa]HCA7376618.1 hypothetical protein [Pseudomonas aeruginosa]HCA7774852.1 hypothetical protein [Pseudomonas aeruginosa]